VNVTGAAGERLDLELLDKALMRYSPAQRHLVAAQWAVGAVFDAKFEVGRFC